MILVTTAGKVRSEAARVLAREGEPVRVLVRDTEKAAALAAAQVEVVQGDLADIATLDGAMRGVDSVVLVSPAVPTHELNVIRSAVDAGVGHVVKVTSDSALDSPIARRRGQAEIEEGLIGSGLGYTLLKCNAFMQNVLMLAGSIAATDSFGASAGQGRIGMIDSRDVAAVAAAIATEPRRHVGNVYSPTGPETLSYSDVAAVLSQALGRKITYRPLTFVEQRQALLDAGLPQHLADDNAKALSLFAEGEADYVTGDVSTILGRPARTFTQFIDDSAAAFS